MADYKLSNAAKDDLIRIYYYGVEKFGMTQADKYFDFFLNTLILFRSNPMHLSVSIILK